MVRSLREGLEGAQFKDWEMPATQFGGIHLGYASLAFDSPSAIRKITQTTCRACIRFRGCLTRPWTHARRSARPPHSADVSARKSGRVRRRGLPTTRWTRVHSQNRCASFPIPSLSRSASNCERRSSRVKNEVAPAYAKFAKFVREDYAPHGRSIPASGPCPTEKLAIASPSVIRRPPISPPTKFMSWHKVGAESKPRCSRSPRRRAPQSEIVQRTYPAGSETARPVGQQLFDLYTRYRDQMYGKLPELFGRLPKNNWTWCRWKSSAAPPPRPPIIPSAPEMARAPDASTSTNMLRRNACCSTWKPSPITRASLDITCNFRSRRTHGLPPFRKFNLDLNAYTRAGRSTPSVGKRSGFYQDPYSEYGRLQNEIWRAVRWVVDTACTLSIGRGSRWSTTSTNTQPWTKKISIPKSIATSHGRRRRFPTKWADEDSGTAGARAEAVGPKFDIRRLPRRWCWIRARCRLMCWKRKSTRGLARRSRPTAAGGGGKPAPSAPPTF